MDMDLIKYKRLVLMIIALLITGEQCKCRSRDFDENPDDIRFKDVIAAVDSMYELINHLPLERRCERYAILLALSATDGLPFEKTVKLLSIAHQDTLNERLKHLEDRKRIEVFMNAVDRYRTLKLGPGFIDLLNCLREIDSNLTEKFLHDRELQLIENLYRQVLESPDVKFSLNKLKLEAFSPSFMRTIRMLFREKLLEDLTSESEAQHEKGLPDIVDSSGQAHQSAPLSGPKEEYKREEKRRRRKEELDRLRERRREEHHRHRERDRLRKRRIRILDPEELRERERISQRKRRDRATEVLREDWRRQALHRKRQRMAQQQTYRLHMLQRSREDPEKDQVTQIPNPIADISALERPHERGTGDIIRKMLKRQQPDIAAQYTTDEVREVLVQQEPEPMDLSKLLHPIPGERIQSKVGQSRPYLPLGFKPQCSLLSQPIEAASSSYGFNQLGNLHHLQRVLLDTQANSSESGAMSFLDHLVQTPDNTVDSDARGDSNQMQAAATSASHRLLRRGGENQMQGADRAGHADTQSDVSSSVNQSLTVMKSLLSHHDHDLGDPWQDFDQEFAKIIKRQ